MRSLLAAFALLLAFPAFPQRDVDATRAFFEALSQAQAGDGAAAAASLGRVLELGDGFMPRRQDFARVWDDPAFAAARDKLEAKLPRLDYAPTAFQLEDRGLIPEGIAYDAPSKSFFVGSIAERKILRVHEDGAVTVFAGPAGELDSILGLAVDAPRRLLYAVSTTAVTTAGEQRRRNAVLAFDVDSRRLVQRYDVPGAQQLNDVAVALGGRVFTTDSTSGAVYEIAVKGPGPSRAILAPGELRGSNGIAAAPDGKRLYIAHSAGLAVLDLAGGGVKRVENRTRESVAAIDGLYEWQGSLVGVQNVTNPGRVIRVSLSPEGDAIVGVKTLLSHHHNMLDTPTTAAVTPRGIFLLATTSVTRYNRQGLIEDPENVPKPAVVRIP
jgi:DNA-binding beta-propeller fold protein YncE